MIFLICFDNFCCHILFLQEIIHDSFIRVDGWVGVENGMGEDLKDIIFVRH